MKDIDLNKLPKYVQKYILEKKEKIKILLSRIKKKDTIIDNLTNNKKSNIYYKFDVLDDNKRYIPSDVIHINYNDIKLEVNLYENQIRIYGRNNILIKPIANNSIRIMKENNEYNKY